MPQDHLRPSPAMQMQVPIVNLSFVRPFRYPHQRPRYLPATDLANTPLPIRLDEASKTVGDRQVQYREILSRIVSLEERMGEIRQAQRAPGIGHNGPHPFDDSDSRAIELAVADLLSQRPSPQIVTTLTAKAEKIRLYLAEHGDTIGLWSILADKLFALAKAVSDWIVSLGGSAF
jgi:hypothetical protein